MSLQPALDPPPLESRVHSAQVLYTVCCSLSGRRLADGHKLLAEMPERKQVRRARRMGEKIRARAVACGEQGRSVPTAEEVAALVKLVRGT